MGYQQRHGLIKEMRRTTSKPLQSDTDLEERRSQLHFPVVDVHLDTRTELMLQHSDSVIEKPKLIGRFARLFCIPSLLLSLL